MPKKRDTHTHRFVTSGKTPIVNERPEHMRKAFGFLKDLKARKTSG